MILTEDSQQLIKVILPKLKTSYKTKKGSLSPIIIKLYNDIVEANKFVKYKISIGCMTSILHDKPLQKPGLYKTKFFPEHIKTFIEESGKHQIIYKCLINGREILIYFALFSPPTKTLLNKYDKYARFMYSWLYICDLYSLKKCAKTLSVYIYLTPFKKTLPNKPNETLSVDNANSAVTYRCVENGEIVLYREEEWMKVFIHETFHTYGLDFTGNLSSANLKNQVREIFHIESDFNIEEAYAETWARIINSVFASYNSLENKKNKQEFASYMNICLQSERLFALYQCNKVLRFMGLSYKDILGTKSKSVYREDTNVFAYYILTSIFLSDYDMFMYWCRVNNNSNAFLKFNETQKNFKMFGDLIANLYNSKTMIDGINDTSAINTNIDWIIKTTRMSCIEIN